MGTHGFDLGDLQDPSRFMQRVADHALALLPGAEGVLVGLRDGDHLRLVCGSGYMTGHVGDSVDLGTSLSGLALRTGRVLRSDDLALDPNASAEVTARLGVRSGVFVPLRRKGVAFGVMTVNSRRPGAFAPADVALLSGLADFLGIAVGLADDLAVVRDNLPSYVLPMALGDEGSATPEQLAVRRFVLNVLYPESAPRLDARSRTQALLDDPGRLSMAFQPVVDIVEGRVMAVEALARFTSEPPRAPDQCFSEAHLAGLGVELELLAVRRALRSVPELPPGVAMTVNVGPETMASAGLAELLALAGPARVVLELTEHTSVLDYACLRSSVQALRAMGARLAVDDTGAGISSLAHILKLAPDFIKLDRGIVSGLDADPARRALASALVNFGADTGARVVAEGAETPDEVAALRRVGVRYVQGYWLGRPGPLADIGWTGEARAAPAAAAV